MQRVEFESNGHQSFVELCALYPTGSLSKQELAELRRHLEVCDNCRNVLAAYTELDRQLVPLLAMQQTNEVPDTMRASQKAKSRLMRAADLDRNKDSDFRPIPVNSFAFFRMPEFLAGLNPAFIAIILLVGFGLAFGIGYSIGGHKRSEQSATRVPQPQTNAGSELATLKNSAARSTDLLNQRDARIADLTEQMQRQSGEIEELKRTLAAISEADLRRQAALSGAEDRAASLARDRTTIEAQLKDASYKLVALQDQLKQANDERASQVLQNVALNRKVEELSGTVAEKDSQMQEQQTLLSSDRDIRELMGARDLFIADVFDIDREGRTKKPFGRVFYTKNRSLIFYAFDLDKQHDVRTRDVAFQAWGLNDTDKHHPQNLGIFYMDNQANRRWVLKFDNPTVLEKINSVFVTIEPNGGSVKPSGKQLLFAYLEAQPNHP